jgi:hypothetical protein
VMRERIAAAVGEAGRGSLRVSWLTLALAGHDFALGSVLDISRLIPGRAPGHPVVLELCRKRPDVPTIATKSAAVLLTDWAGTSVMHARVKTLTGVRYRPQMVARSRAAPGG